MKITKRKLNRKNQIKLLEFCIAEVTARISADLLVIQSNSIALLYRKILQILVCHIDPNTIEIFEGYMK